MSTSNGVVLYEGPSRLAHEADIVVIATGLVVPSRNSKTGPMVQVWIMRSDIEPHDAVHAGLDFAVCGDCPLRAGQGCYVVVAKAPLTVWRCWREGGYTYGSPESLSGLDVRLGAYGDPAAMPEELLRRITACARSWTGYTHSWRRVPALAGLLMASIDQEHERPEAALEGWRTFRVRLTSEPVLPAEIICPASPEGGHRSRCSECGLCDGSRPPTGRIVDTRSDIVIIAHGSGAGRIPEARAHALAVI